MPDIDADTYNKTVALAMWLETAKMTPELTGNLLGGGLLADMLIRIIAAQQVVSRGSQGHYRLLTVSSHYNAQLGLLSALQTGKQTTYPWQSKIPALAAVLVFELHATPQSTSKPTTQPTLDGFAVRAVYQDGPKAQYAVLPLPCAQSGDAAEALAGPGSCTLERFLALTQPQAIVSASDWCEACNNKEVLACRVTNMARQLVEAGLTPNDGSSDGSRGIVASGGSGGGGSSVSPAVIALAVLVSVVGTGLLAVAAVMGVRKYKGRHAGGKDVSSPGPERLQGTQDII
eukprot:GHUV01013052.1.p1 GENE.GHUV01013052.1~~GHUV01013052.1.p1  ORF type:complete len:288 (+),score=66.96 GHUV01013052.1:1217-2080(+)